MLNASEEAPHNGVEIASQLPCHQTKHPPRHHLSHTHHTRHLPRYYPCVPSSTWSSAISASRFLAPTLDSLSEICSVQRFRNIKSFRRLSSLYSSQMAHPRRRLSFSVPAVDKAGRSERLRSLESFLGPSFSSDSLLPNPNPLIIVISGPSGVGKYAVIKKLKETREDLHFVVTATSRAKRPGEMDGKDYYFMTKEEFFSMVERDELMEYALVYGDYKGVPKQQIRDYNKEGSGSCECKREP